MPSRKRARRIPHGRLLPIMSVGTPRGLSNLRRRSPRLCESAGYTGVRGRERGLRMSDDVAALIEAANGGDASALQALFAYVYGELKTVARKQLAQSNTPTLNTTALVHEAY